MLNEKKCQRIFAKGIFVSDTILLASDMDLDDFIYNEKETTMNEIVALDHKNVAFKKSYMGLDSTIVEILSDNLSMITINDKN